MSVVIVKLLDFSNLSAPPTRKSVDAPQKTPNFNNNNSLLCKMCRSAYPLYYFLSFKVTNSQHHIEVVQEKGYCRNYLAISNASSAYSSSYSCPICGKKCHARLHRVQSKHPQHHRHQSQGQQRHLDQQNQQAVPYQRRQLPEMLKNSKTIARNRIITYQN
uniref:Uncharacterized protein n=1 Tax=Glossina pallidipes TaxID=7398 RepID=A0A1A9ZSJ0_GLOPL